MSSSNNPNYDRLKRADRLSDNVLRETAGRTQLVCGHETEGQPVAIYPSRRKLYACPHGCGLVKSKR